MKFYIKEMELDSGQFNATSKARVDAETILKNLDYSELVMPCKGLSSLKSKSKFSLYLQYLKNYKIWKQKLSMIKEEDVLFIQYPLQYPVLFFSKILRLLHRKNIHTTALIHDLESLRYLEFRGFFSYRTKYEDNKVLKLFDKVIAHNNAMKKVLLEKGFHEQQIIVLEVFDYLVKREVSAHKRLNKDMPIIVAGNLLEDKAGYLYQFEQVNNLFFNLYGKGFDEKKSKYLNYYYKGAFLPEELLDVMEGSFGLVWDGTSLDTCDGSYGQYIRYNDPHKLSLYLAADIPIVIWSKAALASFVTENNLGITVDSLTEAPEKINSLTDDEYENIRRSVKRFSSLVHEGYFLKKAITVAENMNSD